MNAAASSARAPVRLTSFDVFDTLLTRTVGEPSSLFLLLGRSPQVQRLTGCSAEQFARLRVDAERRSRHGRRETTLPLIYAELAAGLHLTAEAQEQLIDAEVVLERRLSRLVPGARELVKSCETPRRVALSDMYLPQPVVAQLLEQQGLDDLLDRVVVSSEHGRTKSDAGLYEHLLDTERLRPQDCLHIGDNARSDVRVPKLLGLRATHVDASSLNRYERLWEKQRWDTGGLSSLFAGASRLARLQARHAGDVPEGYEPVVDVAAGVAAPILTAYVLWVLQSAQREGLQRLYFLARDGEVLYLLAKRLCARLGWDMDLRYLYGSRNVYHRAGLATKDVRQATWAWSAMYRLTAQDVLERLGLPDEQASAELARLDVPADAVATDDVVERLLADEPLVRDVQEAARPLLDRVQGYLRQEGMFDGTPYAIVDTGWAGRIAQSLTDVFPGHAEPLRRGYLFGYMKRPDGYARPEVLRGYLFDEHAENGWWGRFEQAYGPLETFTVANHGMTRDFVERDGRYEPVLAGETNPVLDGWPWDGFRRTLFRFVDELTLDTDLAPLSADLRAGVAAALVEFWSHPTDEEAAVWGSYVYEDDILASSHNPLARPIRLADFVHKTRAAYEGKRLWLEASVRLSSPALRPAVRAGLWFNARRRSGPGPMVFVPPTWRRRLGIARTAVRTRGGR